VPLRELVSSAKFGHKHTDLTVVYV
jgi:hypothetical protein